MPESPSDSPIPEPDGKSSARNRSSRDLLFFFLPYARRHLLWGALALLGVLAFGLLSGAVVGLLHPLFEDVLRFEGDMPVLSAERSESSHESRSFLFGPGSLAELPGEWARGIYHRLEETFDVGEDGGRDTLYFVPSLMLGVFLLRSLAQFFSGYSFQRIGLGISTDVRNDLYRRIIGQSSRFHARHPSGELYSRIVSDVSKLESLLSRGLLDFFLHLAAIVVYFLALLSIHLELALVCLLVAPVLVYPIVRFGGGMRRTSHSSQERMVDLSVLLTEAIRGIRIVKAFNMESFECSRFETATSRHLAINLRARLLSSLSSPVIESLAAVGACLLMVSAGRMIRTAQISPATFMQFLTALFLLANPIRQLNRVNLVLQEAAAAADRVIDLLRIPNEVVDAPRGNATVHVRHSIRFEGVRFAYEDRAGDPRLAGRPALEQIDLEIGVGEVVALVGPSGAGKSTLVSLLPRFYDPIAGRVTIDGVDIRHLPIRTLRSLVSIVPQETMLFNDSVRNNIAYGRRDLSLREIRDAARAAYADDFVMELESGYDTVIGEQGCNLSGGQRQRLAIARALLKDAPILVLDEATSQLDAESESSIRRALSNLTLGRTSLIIAHRLSTVVTADRIVVMDEGRILEHGRHDQLLETSGTYRRLYERQFEE